jgi:hypothetical protein
MWTYEYINKAFPTDCVMQTLLVYQDGELVSREVIKMREDIEADWEQFALAFIDSLQNNQQWLP